jgi:hypothetical protein
MTLGQIVFELCVTQKRTYGQTDEWTDVPLKWTKGQFLLFNRGPWPLILLLRNELYCSLLFCLQLDGPLLQLLLLNSPEGQTD